MRNVFKKYNYKKEFSHRIKLDLGSYKDKKEFKEVLEIAIKTILLFQSDPNISKSIKDKKKKIKYVDILINKKNIIATSYYLIKQKEKVGRRNNYFKEIFGVEKNKIMRSRVLGVNLRLEVFKRDKYTCQYCGWRNGTNKGDRVLHIDHKIPVYFGGSNKINNLITACYKCNISKNNKVLMWEH